MFENREQENIPLLGSTAEQNDNTNSITNEDLEVETIQNKDKMYFYKTSIFYTNENSLRNLTVTNSSIMILDIDGFKLPSYLSSSITIFGWTYLFQPFIKALNPKIYLPNCANEPNILLNMDFDVSFVNFNNSLLPKIQSSVLNPDFIPKDFSHTICVATEDYVLTPLDLMIEYIGRNKVESEEEDERDIEDVFWKDDMNLGLSMSGLKWFKGDMIEYPVNKELISNSTFVKNLEVLNKVDFNNTKFNIFDHKVSGDFYIEISLDFLKNIDIINFKMLKGDFFISLDGSDKRMMLVKIPEWQKCSVRSIKTEDSEGLDMVIELGLKDADVEILNDAEFTKFGKRWFLDKKVGVQVESILDLIISEDEWLGSMVLRHLKSTDSTVLRN
ncbi:unnamed protein product [Hanseniaspora opuntiae]